MGDETKVWLDTINKTVEGHTNTCTLFYNDKIIWGPRSCHDNTVDLQTVLRKADPRLELRLARKDHSVEGHTRAISVMSKGEVILNKLSCHDNMEGLVTAINTIWVVSPPE
ncbi:hypothetical protein B0T12DRAFT_165499 [Alternaria alternata]|nr:hypothetical protein B0T12DRAFT_165499 [Alternaria alternata]